MEIKRINEVSLGKFLGILYALLGIIISVISFIEIVFVLLTTQLINYINLIIILIGLIITPLLLGGLGFIGGYLMALIYNLIAKKYGGIKLEVKK